MNDSLAEGARLRAIREERGLTLRDLAERTRIDDRFLRAIEAADYSPFRARLFAVSFARSYAGALGQPCEPVMAEARRRYAECVAC